MVEVGKGITHSDAVVFKIVFCDVVVALQMIESKERRNVLLI